ncbi:unnamed protein product [Haemonchus placei]|uniref:Beta-lactamase domain-containing protein n=1 Tax=Haemonchus placei TaxID=6290 RepID=A0A0N4WE03_HAEPC|nr:unnamed protein product [Haemonchus placei]
MSWHDRHALEEEWSQFQTFSVEILEIPTASILQVDHRLIGHTGLGGQNLRWDEENRLVIAFLSNGLKGGLGDRARTYVRLVETIYDCLPKATETSECDKSTKNMTIDQNRMVSARASIRTS